MKRAYLKGHLYQHQIWNKDREKEIVLPKFIEVYDFTNLRIRTWSVVLYFFLFLNQSTLNRVNFTTYARYKKEFS